MRYLVTGTAVAMLAVLAPWVSPVGAQVDPDPDRRNFALCDEDPNTDLPPCADVAETDELPDFEIRRFLRFLRDNKVVFAEHYGVAGDPNELAGNNERLEIGDVYRAIQEACGSDGCSTTAHISDVFRSSDFTVGGFRAWLQTKVNEAVLRNIADLPTCAEQLANGNYGDQYTCDYSGGGGSRQKPKHRYTEEYKLRCPNDKCPAVIHTARPEPIPPRAQSAESDALSGSNGNVGLSEPHGDSTSSYGLTEHNEVVSKVGDKCFVWREENRPPGMIEKLRNGERVMVRLPIPPTSVACP